MKFFSAFIVLIVVVGVYSNCGCLKCNQQLSVLSPRGSGLKVIYKNQPCSCLTSVPYSVQIPVPPPAPCGGRCYGYQVQEAQVPEPVACPIPQQYNVQLQIPKIKPPPSYLVGLVAKTDRVLLSGPPEPLPAPGCPQPQIEPIQVVQDTDSDVSGNLWYYGNPPQSGGCGCFRYDEKPPKVHQNIFNTPLLNLLLLQKHFYTPPKSSQEKNKIRKFQQENFYRFPISEIFKKSEIKKNVYYQRINHEKTDNSALKHEIIRLNPGIIRIYRQIFLLPAQKNSDTSYEYRTSQNSAINKPSLPKSYKQVFLKSQPKLFWVNPNFDILKIRKSILSDQRRNKIQNFDQGSLDQKNQELNSNFLNSDLNFRKDVHPGIDFLRSIFPINPKENELKIQNPGRRLRVQNLKTASNLNKNLKANGERKSEQNSGIMHKLLPKLLPIISNQGFSQNKSENYLDLNRVQDSNNSQLNIQKNLSKIQKSDFPKNFHMVKSQKQQLLLTKGKSGSETVFLSTSQQFSATSDSQLAETFDSILSKNREKRSINLKMLARKPENPPRFLRMHNPSQRSFQNYRNEEQISSSRSLSPKGKFKNLQTHGRTPFNHGMDSSSVYGGYGGRYSTYGMNPSAHGLAGRHAIHGVNPSVYGFGARSTVNGRGHENHSRKSLLGSKKLSRFPRENERKKKVQPKKKKNNAILKSTWKKANKIIKDWFIKGSPLTLTPPEVQLPSFESSKKSAAKNLLRHKRKVKDEGLLPLFTFPEEKPERKRLGRRKPIKEDKNAEQVEARKPEEAFLEPLNFDHIFHPTPILHLLNTPIRCLNHLHKLKSHVSPVAGTIPKVIQVSRRYVVGLMKNLGKHAIHFGTHFLKGFTNLKKLKILPKRRLRRDVNTFGDDQDLQFSSQAFPVVGEEDVEKIRNYEDLENLNVYSYGDIKEGGKELNQFEENEEMPIGEVIRVNEKEGLGNTKENRYEDVEEAGDELNQFKKSKGRGIGEEIKIEGDGLKNVPDEEEMADKLLAQLMNQKEFQETLETSEQEASNKKTLDEHQLRDIASFAQGTRKKRGADIFLELIKLLLGLGSAQDSKENQSPKPQNEDEKIEVHEEVKNQKGDLGDDYGNSVNQNNEGLNPKDTFTDTHSNIDNLQPKDEVDVIQNTLHEDVREEDSLKHRKKRGIVEVFEELEKSGNDIKRFSNVWKALDPSVDEKALPNLSPSHGDEELNLNNKVQMDIELLSVEDSRRKRRNVLETPELERKVISAQPTLKPFHTFALDLIQAQTIKEKIAQILTNIQTLRNYDFAQNLDIYQGLLKLQDIKNEIVLKWKTLNFKKNPEDFLARKNELFVEIKEAQDLKDLIFQEVLERIKNQDGIFKENWIKILVRLQKLHCAVKNLNQKLEEQDFNIKFLERLVVVNENNQKGLLVSLERDKEVKLEAQNELIQNLKKILDHQNVEKIKEEAKIIWEINNIEKLQNVSILELNQKLSQGLEIRKELKILFDLQKQLEKCEQKQKVLMADLRKNFIIKEENY